MTQHDLQHEVQKHNYDDIAQYEKERVRISEAKEFTFSYLKKNLTTWVRCNHFIAGYHDAKDPFNIGSYEAAFQATEKRMKELRQVDFEDSRIVEFGDYEIVCDNLAKQAQEAVPTGIKFIDDAMGGGLQPQTWTTFLGGSNVGKSMLCPNLAYYAAQKGKKTFVVVHEDEELPTKARYLSRFSGIPYMELTQPRLLWSDETKLAVKKADEFLRSYVRIRFMYGQDAFLEKVMDAARNEKQDWDFHLFLDDYGQCLKSSAYRSMEDRYGLHEYIYEQLKQLCLELDIAGAGGAQTNRAGHKVNRSGADLLRMTDVGDSWGICKKSSNVITMNRSVVDIQENRIKFLLDKVRNGSKCPVAVACKTDYARCTTHVPYMQNELSQTEVHVEEGERKT